MSDKIINYVNIRNGIAYEVNSDVPYTGRYGSKDGTESGLYQNGLREGEWRILEFSDVKEDADGLGYSGYTYFKVCNFSCGKMNGKCLIYGGDFDSALEAEQFPTEDDPLYLEVDYRDDVVSGKVVYYYENGQKKEESIWSDGEKDGLEVSWYENGQMMSRRTFENGSVVGEFEGWTENGGVISEKELDEREKIKRLYATRVRFDYLPPDVRYPDVVVDYMMDRYSQYPSMEMVKWLSEDLVYYSEKSIQAKLISLDVYKRAESSESPDSKCYVITACMGDAGHPYVCEMRSLRNDVLLKSKFGKRFVSFYYGGFGEKAAEFIGNSFVLKKMSRYFLVFPIVAIYRFIRYIK